MIEIIKKPNFNFIGIRKYCYIISCAIIISGIISIIAHKGLNYGIDFTGGTIIILHTDNFLPIGIVREKLSSVGISGIIQAISGTKYEYLIRTAPIEGMEDKITNTINHSKIKSVERIEPTISEKFKKKTFWVIFFGFVVILLYVWVRFTFRWGVCAVIALIHDVLVTVTFLSILNKEFTIPIIAALLTIIGYSINDTIIVSDRVRENLRLMRKMAFDEIVNKSINQTLSRTLLTSITTLIVLIVLLIFGGRVIHDFALTLFIGVIAGTYSSIYIVSALVVDWERFSPTRK